MKLIPLTILVISLAVDTKAQKFRQEQFPFPPQFQTQNSGLFPSDSSHYLPPESHTTIPYFPIKNVNNLQFPYLPPTGTKAPSIFPSPFPFIMSSTLVSKFDEDEDDEDDSMIRMSTPFPPIKHNDPRLNRTGNNQDVLIKDKREMRSTDPRMINFQQPIDRIDVKFPLKYSPPVMSTSAPVSQTPATRRMIISAETHRNDLDLDQIKAASFQGNPFLQGPVFISSTTEPAIPILRLSNEMDLDGSFSYEALGADQTHYVQHSHMENMGTDKEEQVVEGSYSYVGDNGQTYTVHYIADSNGFRASGDHLPVAPPVPEIIQRSIQYNLAEEAKRPPHLKSWQDEESEINDSDKNHRFSLPPPRNLFTGRTPEAFSYSYSQGSNAQNNLVTAATTQVPVKTIDFTTEQSRVKVNNGPISPQITFLASQGAHVPSINTVQNSIARMFTTEKPAMPQIVNYEARIKESDQDSNKALWRWQYGINSNNLSLKPNKDTISRSFGEGDDVIINFNEMTPEQYTKVISSKFEPSSLNVPVNHYMQGYNFNETPNNYIRNNNLNADTNVRMENQNVNTKLNNNYPVFNEDNQQSSSPQTTYPHPEQWYRQMYGANQYPEFQSTLKPFEKHEFVTENKPSLPIDDSHFYSDYSTVQYRPTNNPDQIPQFPTTTIPMESSKLNSKTKPKIITQRDFIFPSQTVTQSYDYEENYYEPRKIKTLNMDMEINSNINNAKAVPENVLDHNETRNNDWSTTNIINNEMKLTTTHEPPFFSTARFTEFSENDSKNDFKPIMKTSTEETRVYITTSMAPTTEAIVEDIFQNNIFLKNLFMPEKAETKNSSKISEEPKKVIHTKVEAEPKTDKIPKFIQYQSKPDNEIKSYKKKPMDFMDILNYVSMKNNFESGKIKTKSKTTGSNNFDHRSEIRFIPVQQERNEESNINSQEQEGHRFRNLNHEKQEELRGIIKNYKVLHRNNNNMSNKHEHQLRRDLSPPPLKSLIPPLGRAGPSMKSYLPPIYV